MLGNTQNPVDSNDMSMSTHKRRDHNVNLVVHCPFLCSNVCTSSIGKNSGITQPQHGLIPDSENMVSQSKHHLWQRPCPADYDMLNKQEDCRTQ